MNPVPQTIAIASGETLSRVKSRKAGGPVLMTATLAAADVITTGLAVILGFSAWSLMNPSIPPLQPVMALAPAFCVAILAFENLYPGIGMGAVDHIRRGFS